MILCNDHWLLINKLISVSILSSSAMVIIQVNVMSCTGTLRSQSTTVHSRVPVMCGATASHCGRCIHWVTNRTMKWLAARCDLSFLCLRRTTLTGRGLVFSTCLSVCPSVRSFVCYHTCEHDILKTNELIFDFGQRARAWDDQLGCQKVKGQGHTRLKNGRFEGLEHARQLTGPRFLAIFLDRWAVGQLSAKGPGHFRWIDF